jgi:hypothetical protein
MNTRHKWDTTATVYDPERKAWWESVFDTNCVPIKDLRPQLCKVPLMGETLAYLLDLAALWPDQRVKLVEGLAQTFGLPVEVVSLEIDRGVPIPVAGVYVHSTDPVMIAMLEDAYDHGLDNDLEEQDLRDHGPDW